MDEAARQIAGHGILGAMLVVLSWAYYKQGQAFALVQEARVADAKKVAETLLALQDRWQDTVSELTEAVQKIPGARR